MLNPSWWQRITTHFRSTTHYVSEKTRILYIANPNNPTGTYLDSTELLRLREELPDYVILMIDDAYVEYSEVLARPMH